MSADTNPWILSSLPSGVSPPDRTSIGPVPKGQFSATDEQRELLLQALHTEAAVLRRSARLGTLTESEREYLADLQREIDHYESARPSLRDGDLWRRVDELAERVLASRG
jgi:hypothetical protein